jgi:hypothetical protein
LARAFVFLGTPPAALSRPLVQPLAPKTVPSMAKPTATPVRSSHDMQPVQKPETTINAGG